MKKEINPTVKAQMVEHAIERGASEENPIELPSDWIIEPERIAFAIRGLDWMFITSFK